MIFNSCFYFEDENKPNLNVVFTTTTTTTMMTTTTTTTMKMATCVFDHTPFFPLKNKNKNCQSNWILSLNQVLFFPAKNKIL
jgi:hypothetical protein